MHVFMLAVITLAVLAVAPASAAVEPLKVLYDNKLDRSVVVVVYANRQYGTGWWVNEHYIVTAAHVTDYQANVPVTILHGDYESKGYVVGLDRSRDVAVIYVEQPMPDATILPLCEHVVKGQEMIIVGYPFELLQITGDLVKASANPRAAYGIIAWVGHDKSTYYIAEIQATTDEGNSGGPAIDLDAHCALGAVTFALKGEAGTLYYITNVYYIQQLLDKYSIPYTVKQNTMMDEGQPLEFDSSWTSDSTVKAAIAGAVAGICVVALTIIARAGAARAAVLLLALVVAAAATAHAATPFMLAYGDNTSMVRLPLEATSIGAIEPGYAYTFKLHAEAVFHCYGKYEYVSAALGLMTSNGTVWVGISVEQPTPLFPPFISGNLMIAVDSKTVWKQEIAKVFPCQSGEFDANVKIDYHCDGTVVVIITGHGYSHTYRFKEPYLQPIVVLAYAGGTGEAKSSVYGDDYAAIEECAKTSTNPWGQPSGGTGEDSQNQNNDGSDLEKYALYGIGGTAALALLLAATRGGGGVTVVSAGGGRTRGMVQILGIAAIAAIVAGAILGWKLHTAVTEPTQPFNTTAIVLGVVVVVMLLFVLATRRGSQVIIVGGR